MRKTGHVSLQTDDRMTVGCDDETKSKSGKVAASIADDTCATKPHLALNFQSSQRVARGIQNQNMIERATGPVAQTKRITHAGGSLARANTKL